MMIARSVLFTAIAVTTMLTACGQTETEAAEELARARLEAAERVAAARQRADAALAAHQATANGHARSAGKLTPQDVDAMIENANSAFEAARAEAMKRHETAEIQCDALEGVDKIACLSTADAELAADEAAAISHRDEALAGANYQH
jgi:hypothetical protein